MKHNFKELRIWQVGMDITDVVFTLGKSLPTDERYNLIDQMNRSSCSIPSNIAEGCGKRTEKHFAEFLSTSLSSSYELETQVLICQRRKFGNPEALEKLLSLINEERKMIFSFRDKIYPERKPFVKRAGSFLVSMFF